MSDQTKSVLCRDGKPISGIYAEHSAPHSFEKTANYPDSLIRCPECGSKRDLLVASDQGVVAVKNP